jgi:hypothetical protein
MVGFYLRYKLGAQQRPLSKLGSIGPKAQGSAKAIARQQLENIDNHAVHLSLGREEKKRWLTQFFYGEGCGNEV